MATTQDPSASAKGLSRRGLIGGTVAGASLGGGGFLVGRASRPTTPGAPEVATAATSARTPASVPPASAGTTTSVAVSDVVSLYGAHQPGIVTPPPARMHFVAFDVVTHSREELQRLLRRWTAASARMMRADGAGPIGPVGGAPSAVPDDTGEALDLPAANLTVTVGFGPSLFGRPGRDNRFGLAHRRPAELRRLPRFRGDDLQHSHSHGDLGVQICADDPQVAFHAARNLARIGHGVVRRRWTQTGFGVPTSAAPGPTPRNLFGFKDGTSNISRDDTERLRDSVWVAAGDDRWADWLTGGTYLVARRARLDLEAWDEEPLAEQEHIFGRRKGSGAPLTGHDEFDPPDFEATAGGRPLMPRRSHVRVVHPELNGGRAMLRRGYNFDDGIDQQGRLNAGLFFVGFVRSPERQFIPVQRAMADHDLLMEYVRFTGSAIFAVPPGVAGSGDYVGSALFQ